jgi:hypothetical protein
VLLTFRWAGVVILCIGTQWAGYCPHVSQPFTGAVMSLVFQPSEGLGITLTWSLRVRWAGIIVISAFGVS